MLINLIGVLFLIITLSVGTHVVADKKYDFNIFEEAAKPKKTGNSAFDKCREESGREVCNERLGINVNWKGEIVNEIDTSKVDKTADPKDPTCDSNGVQYSPGAVVMYGGIGSNATCGSDGKWDVGVGATIDIKPENVPEYAKGSDKLKKQIEVEEAIVEAEKQVVVEQAIEPEEIERIQEVIEQEQKTQTATQIQTQQPTAQQTTSTTSTSLEKTDEGFIRTTTTIIRDATGKVVDTKSISTTAKTTSTFAQTPTDLVRTDTKVTTDLATGKVVDTTKSQTTLKNSVAQPTTSITVNQQGSVSIRQPAGSVCTFSSDCESGGCVHSTCQANPNPPPQLNALKPIPKAIPIPINPADRIMQLLSGEGGYTSVPIATLLDNTPTTNIFGLPSTVSQDAINKENLQRKTTSAGIGLAYSLTALSAGTLAPIVANIGIPATLLYAGNAVSSASPWISLATASYLTVGALSDPGTKIHQTAQDLAVIGYTLDPIAFNQMFQSSGQTVYNTALKTANTAAYQAGLINKTPTIANESPLQLNKITVKPNGTILDIDSSGALTLEETLIPKLLVNTAPALTTSETGLSLLPQTTSPIAAAQTAQIPSSMLFAPTLDNLPNTPARVIMDDLLRPLPNVEISNPITTIQDLWKQNIYDPNVGLFPNWKKVGNIPTTDRITVIRPENPMEFKPVVSQPTVGEAESAVSKLESNGGYDALKPLPPGGSDGKISFGLEAEVAKIEIDGQYYSVKFGQESSYVQQTLFGQQTLIDKGITNFAPVTKVETSNGTYLVQRWVDGKDVFLDKQNITTQLRDAGVIIDDIRNNAIITDNGPVIIDFGNLYPANNNRVANVGSEPTVLDISNLPNTNQYHLLNKAIPDDLKPLEDHLAKAASLIKAGKYDEAINLMMDEDLARKFGVSVELGRGVYLSENLKTNEISESDFINISDFIASVAKHELGSITAPAVSWHSLQDLTPIPNVIKREVTITFLEEWVHELQTRHQVSLGMPYSKLHKDTNHEDEVVLYLNNVLKIKLSEPYINRPFYDREQLGLRAYSLEEIMDEVKGEMAKTNHNAFKNIGQDITNTFDNVKNGAGTVVKAVFSPLKYVAGGIISAAFLDNYFDLGITDPVYDAVNSWTTGVSVIYALNNDKKLSEISVPNPNQRPYDEVIQEAIDNHTENNPDSDVYYSPNPHALSLVDIFKNIFRKNTLDTIYLIFTQEEYKELTLSQKLKELPKKFISNNNSVIDSILVSSVDSNLFTKQGGENTIESFDEDMRNLITKIEQESKNNNGPVSHSFVIEYFLEKNNGDLTQSIFDASNFEEYILRGWGQEMVDDPYLWVQNHILDEYSPLLPYQNLPIEEARLENSEIYYDYSLQNRLGEVYHAANVTALLNYLPPEIIRAMVIGEYLVYGNKHGLIKLSADLEVLKQLDNINDLLNSYK